MNEKTHYDQRQGTRFVEHDNARTDNVPIFSWWFHRSRCSASTLASLMKEIEWLAWSTVSQSDAIWMKNLPNGERRQIIIAKNVTREHRKTLAMHAYLIPNVPQERFMILVTSIVRFALFYHSDHRGDIPRSHIMMMIGVLGRVDC